MTLFNNRISVAYRYRILWTAPMPLVWGVCEIRTMNFWRGSRRNSNFCCLLAPPPRPTCPPKTRASRWRLATSLPSQRFATPTLTAASALCTHSSMTHLGKGEERMGLFGGMNSKNTYSYRYYTVYSIQFRTCNITGTRYRCSTKILNSKCCYCYPDLDNFNWYPDPENFK